jgi:hypothetical protein
LLIQNFNRYSYAVNNPLCYIDRDGKIFWLIPVAIAAVIGGYIGGATANHSYNPFDWNWKSGNTWSHIGIGMLIGGASAGAAILAAPVVGGALCSAIGIGTGGLMGGAVVGAVGGAVGGLVSGAGFTALGGGNLKESLMGGLKGMAIGAAAGAVSGGLVGGGKALLDGKNVWTGENIAQGRSAFSFKNTPLINNPGPANEPLPVKISNVDVPETNNAIPEDISNNWTQSPSDKGGGIVYKDPNNLHNSIRIMPGNLESPNPAQQQPYVIYRHNGIPYDVNGLALPNGKLPEAHIPLNLFNINKMPR